jgi:uncharacterized membrane protein YtjA (UPF0391 family)
MLRLAFAMLLISIIAGLLGFTSIAAGTAAIAKIIFGVFLALALLFFVMVMMGIGALRGP